MGARTWTPGLILILYLIMQVVCYQSTVGLHIQTGKRCFKQVLMFYADCVEVSKTHKYDDKIFITSTV
jgi:hypothetical protein